MDNQAPELVQITTKERGWAGHFCCAADCKFRRNTLVSHSDGRSIIVSTVGNYWPAYEPSRTEPEYIGYKRHYETMAFWAEQVGQYVDCATHKYVGEIYETLNWLDHKEDADNLANDMHEKAVLETIELLKNPSFIYKEEEDEDE